MYGASNSSSNKEPKESNSYNINDNNETKKFLKSSSNTRDLIANTTKFASNFIHNNRLGDFILGSNAAISSGEKNELKVGLWSKILLNKGWLLEGKSYNILGSGFSVGFDYRVLNNAILGSFLSFSSSKIIRDKNEENLNCALMGIYGKLELYKNLSIDLVFGGNRAKITNISDLTNSNDPLVSWFLDFRSKYLIHLNKYNKIIPTLGYRTNSKQMFACNDGMNVYTIDRPTYHSFIIGSNWVSNVYTSEKFDVSTNVHFFYEQSIINKKPIIITSNNTSNNSSTTSVLSLNELTLSGNDLINLGFSATANFFYNQHIALGLDWQHKKDYDNLMFKAKFIINL